jgi:glycosyltransferase involved in cell wall biosynthesis
MGMTIHISACIMCRNEAEKIGRALDSLAWADEVVVVDSGSTDGTVEIARAHATRPRVIHNDWPGYRAQREFMVGQCRNAWVFMLDADEEVSAGLAAALKEIQKKPDHGKLGIMAVPRRNYIARRYVRCWSPDYQKRLIHKDRIAWDSTSQFDTWGIKEGFTIGWIKAPGMAIEHNRLSPLDLKDFTDAGLVAERGELMATHLYNNGKRATFLHLLLRPWLTFLKYYILRGAFLDGRFGLVIAYKTTMGVMAKYSVLYGVEVVRLHDKYREGNER